jgi:hypothetical protein
MILFAVIYSERLAISWDGMYRLSCGIRKLTRYNYPVCVSTWNMNFTSSSGLQIEGVLAYFTHFKCQKRIGDDVRRLNMKNENDPPDTFYPTYYARI